MEEKLDDKDNKARYYSEGDYSISDAGETKVLLLQKEARLRGKKAKSS